jgi:hypothetical protein
MTSRPGRPLFAEGYEYRFVCRLNQAPDLGHPLVAHRRRVREANGLPP